MKYGTKVFGQLLPILQSSVGEHHKNDSLVRYKRMLEDTATPGMRYLLVIGPTGTNLVTVGVKVELDGLATCMRQVEPEQQEIYYVEVREGGQSSTRIARERAIHLANEKPMLTMKGSKDPFGVTPAMYKFWMADDLAGTASVHARYDRTTNRTLVHVGASVAERHPRLARMHMMLLVEDAAAGEAGSLIWSFGNRLVNDLPYEVWSKRLTECVQLAAAA
jgi:hypothetical protein